MLARSPQAVKMITAEHNRLGTCPDATVRADIRPHLEVRRDRDDLLRSMPGVGRAGVRAALSMAAVSRVGCDPALKGLDDRLVGRGKAKRVALVACTGKLLRILNAMVRPNSRWDAQHGVPTVEV